MIQTKKTIIFYPFYKERHNLYDDPLEFLTEEYDIIYNPKTGYRDSNSLLFKLMKWYPLRMIYHKFIRKFLRLNDIRFIFRNRDLKRLPYELIYTIADIPPFENNYIIDFEKLTSLANHDFNKLDKKVLEEAFAKDNCKAIIPWYSIAERSLREFLDCSKFEHKIKTIPFGIKSTKISKNYNKDKIAFLFISSKNNPLDFGVKGGTLALEVYKRLTKKYPNKLTFTIRAEINSKIKQKYKNVPGIKFIDRFLSDEELEKLFLDSDILLEPVPGNKLMLECLNYAIPSITFDHWELPEFCVDGKTGFNVDCSLVYGPIKTKEQLMKHLKNHHINYLGIENRKWEESIIGEYVEKTSKLIENKKLRIQMSKNSKKMVEKNGRFNFDKMKKDLLEVFEKSMS